MMRTRARRFQGLRSVAVATMLLALVATAVPVAAGPADEIARLIHERIEPVQRLIFNTSDEEPSQERTGIAPDDPAAALPDLIEQMEARLASSPPAEAALRSGLERTREAYQAYTFQETDLDFVMRLMESAAVALESDAPPTGGPPPHLDFAAALIPPARLIVVRMIDRAEAGGVDPATIAAARADVDAGDALAAAWSNGPAIAKFHQGFGRVAPTIQFDLDLFEQGIVDRLAGNTGGYAYVIGVDGQLARSGASGLARRNQDPPALAHNPAKKQYLASISKTITAIAAIRLLDQQNISIDEKMWPWLPPHWVLGPNITQISFRQLLTHRSGFRSGSQSYDGIRNIVAAGVNIGDIDDYEYENSNFGIFRMLIAELSQPQTLADMRDLSLQLDWWWTATLYNLYVQSAVLQPSGVVAQCRPENVNPTLYYAHPDDGQPGGAEGDRTLTCGGGGWFMSANELGSVLAFTRFTNTILSANARAAMNAGFLGWSNPVDGNGWAGGTFGTYHGKGGDRPLPPGDAHTCAMNFPAGVQASLVINTAETFTGYQCTLLKNAYEDAWVG